VQFNDLEQDMVDAVSCFTHFVSAPAIPSPCSEFCGHSHIHPALVRLSTTGSPMLFSHRLASAALDRHL
jgi:hypothetical protein